ncbi:MAG: LysM peptidoglycan-binding domain-containing protein [Rhodospirillales bacterium]
MPSLSHPAVIAALGLVAIVIAIMLNLDTSEDVRPERPPVVTGTGPEAEPAPALSSAPASVPAQTPQPASGAESEPGAAVAAPPAFDVVRIGRDGGAVMAGRAAPGSAVEIRGSDTVLGEVTADARGEWVFVPETPLPPGETVFSLAMRMEGRDEPVLSEESVLIMVPEPDRLTAGGDEPGGAVVLKIAPDGTTRLMNRPEPQPAAEAGAGGAAAQALAIETIDYGAKGRISIGGRALPGMQIVLYINNQPAGGATADADGFWRVTPEIEIPPGAHTVRVDQIGPGGDIVARVMIPFVREEIAGIPASGGYVTVQPGNSLWRIARHAYGEGFSYTVIYRANADQISDPDLIYPGQILKLPENE